MTLMDDRNSTQTDAIHAGDKHNPTSAISSPIFQSSASRFDDPDEISKAMDEIAHPDFYGRYASYNTKQCEATIAKLEKAEAAIVTGSGMAAISLALFSLLESGDHIVAQRVIYPTAYTLIKRFDKYRITATFINSTEPESFDKAINENTKLIYIESPANPVLALTDIAAIAEVARSHNILLIVDNTFATPHNQKPLSLGADIVVHSATKYLGGHSDLVAGVVIGRKALLDGFWKSHILFGAVLHPFEAWLLERGLKTFPIRMESHNNNALLIAEYLESHPAVENVYYPGLASNPQYNLAVKQMNGGFGGMVSFELNGGWEASRNLLKRVRIISNAVSLGGVHSLITHPASTVSSIQSEEEIAESGVSSGLIRLSVGLEDHNDLIQDLTQALA